MGTATKTILASLTLCLMACAVEQPEVVTDDARCPDGDQEWVAGQCLATVPSTRERATLVNDAVCLAANPLPCKPTIYVNRGDTTSNEVALAILRHLAAAAPSDPIILNNLAVLVALRGNYEDASAKLDSALAGVGSTLKISPGVAWTILEPRPDDRYPLYTLQADLDSLTHIPSTLSAGDSRALMGGWLVLSHMKPFYALADSVKPADSRWADAWHSRFKFLRQGGLFVVVEEPTTSARSVAARRYIEANLSIVQHASNLHKSQP